jgi:hypothetical protein
MKKTLCYIAGLGFILGLIVHIVSLFGIYLGEKIPFIWVLHVGIFIVWLPAVLELRKNTELKQPNFGTMVNPFKFFGIIFKDTPKPVMIISVVFFFYAMINFFLFMQAGQGGVPDIMDGKYVIHNHGSIIKELTETEYFKMKANEIRGFSGHWMAFYGLAMGILWPKTDKQE